MAAIVIANENANWGAGRGKIRRATDFLHRQGFPFSLGTTERPGHARELAAAAAAQGIDTVIVMGGDGTINEVVNGLVSSGPERIPGLGIVPVGSSNDFSKSLGIPQGLEDACRAVLKGRVRSVDVGQVASDVPNPAESARGPAHHFCSASCLGYFAQVAARSLEKRRLRGSLRYVMPAFGVIRDMTDGWEMSVRTEAQVWRGAYAVLLIANAPRFGGLTMLPQARPDDGVLDCLLVEMVSKWEALQLIPLVYRKALEHHRKVIRFQARSISVALRRPTLLCQDGEMVPGSFENLEYRVLARRLQVLG